MREVTTPRALRTITRLTNILRLCMGISDDKPVDSSVPQTVITNNTTEILNLDLRTPVLSVNILNSLYYPSLKSFNLSLPDYADPDTVSFRARAEPEDEYDDPDFDTFDGVALDFYWNQTLEPDFCGSHIIFPILELFKDIEILKISDSNSLGRDILVSADPNWRGLHLYRRDYCPLPKLTKLVIKSEKIRMFGGTLLRVLLAFVTYRRDMYEDAAIGEIDFARCNGYSAYITSQLEQHDVDVTWDGIYVEPCALDETRMGRSMRHVFSKRVALPGTVNRTFLFATQHLVLAPFALLILCNHYFKHLFSAKDPDIVNLRKSTNLALRFI
ncbi:hypothetical protein EWM64_g2651 [Hericium alpestre]|uniref:Uncharacterized protein n=1 Tax=Hericium alpestre TaxID=135208 RepID=A0A4Z0A2U9_9AGAM|nr:hypothetical protein EWM64_g2651 [Hericium alpestre]